MNIQRFNQLSDSTAFKELFNCCGSDSWVKEMLEQRPFSNSESLLETASLVWKKQPDSAFLQAFTHHPKIGDVSELEKKFASTANWASGEQSGAAGASPKVLQDLKTGNDHYFEKFGFIFIVCATGKSAQEMLDLLDARIGNDADKEILIAAGEQDKITKIRLEKQP